MVVYFAQFRRINPATYLGAVAAALLMLVTLLMSCQL
jgi:hypothetical protein